MALYDYRIATGHDVALGSLDNIEDVFLSVLNRRILLPPKTQPVNPYPIQTPLGSGRVSGHGTVTHIWHWDIFPYACLKKLLDDYLTTSGTVVNSKACTIYTRDHPLETYRRYNAYIVKPIPGDDFTWDRKHIFNLNLRFNDLREP